MAINALKKVQKNLKNYFTYSKNSSIIVVSESKEQLPFCYIIEDGINHPNNLLVAFAVDYGNCFNAANVALEVNKIKDIILTEEFYISKSGVTHWGEEALKHFEIDNYVDLENLRAISEELN